MQNETLQQALLMSVHCIYSAEQSRNACTRHTSIGPCKNTCLTSKSYFLYYINVRKPNFIHVFDHDSTKNIIQFSFYMLSLAPRKFIQNLIRYWYCHKKECVLFYLNNQIPKEPYGGKIVFFVNFNSSSQSCGYFKLCNVYCSYFWKFHCINELL